MSVTTILAAKYAPTVIKALIAYYGVEHKELADLPLKALENILKDKISEFEKSGEFRRLTNEILLNLEALIGSEVDQATFESAVSIASVSLETLPLYPLLFDQLLDMRTFRQSVDKAMGIDRPDESAVGSLHFRILEATAKSFAAHIEKLPGFRDWFVREVRRRFVQIDDRLGRIDERLNTFERFAGSRARNDLEFEIRYRQHLGRQLDKVELFVEHSDLAEIDYEQKLSIAYVMLRLGEGRDAAEQGESVPASTLLAESGANSRRLFILGKAGSGKTTLLRWSGLQAVLTDEGYTVDKSGVSESQKVAAAEETSSTEQVNGGELSTQSRSADFKWRDRVPFFLRLRDYKDGKFPAPSEYTSQIMPTRMPPPQWAERILEGGRALLLIDGLDELRPAVRQKGLEWIRSLANDNPAETVIIVTSRPQAVAEGVLSENGFSEYEVRDLSRHGQLEFVEHWHRAVRARLGNRQEKIEELNKREQRLRRELRENRSLVVLAANPLLAALTCALNRVSRNALPKSLYDLCESAIRMLLWGRDRLQDTDWQSHPSEYTELTYEKRLLVTRNIAYECVMHGESTINEATSLSVIAESLYLTDGQGSSTAQSILRGLMERSNLLRRCAIDEIEFVHNSIRDFLAATRFVERGESKFLAFRALGQDSQKWENILAFAAATTTRPSFGPELVSELFLEDAVAQGSLADKDLVILNIASHCRFPLPPKLQARLYSIQTNNLPLDSVAKVQAIANSGSAAVPYLEPNPTHSAAVTIACIQALAKINDNAASEMLTQYLEHELPPAVLEILAEAVGLEAFSRHKNVLDIPSVVEGISTLSSGPHPAIPFIKDLSPLLQSVWLESLNLCKSKVEDLSPLAGLFGLKELGLSYTKVSDLTPLAGLKELKTLWINSTDVKDLQPLEQLEMLRVLLLGGSQVSPKEAENLRLKLIKCNVYGV